MKTISRTVWVLSLVSLFTDVASEMLYPVMPVYLSSIGFSVIYIGILEGIAEAIAGVSKGYFGKLSDNVGKRLPFVRVGYGLSALSKPMMALFVNAWWVLLARTTDRLGKGIRTGARDALLSDEATEKTKASVFGFHRSMDTLGAVCGPLFALAFLYYRPGEYKSLFYIAFIPGVLAILLTFLIKEKNNLPRKSNVKTAFLDFVRYWKAATPQYRRLVAGLLLFALLNSSDVFLLLKVKEAGFSDTWTIGLYVFYNLVYASLAYVIGKMADRKGLKNVFTIGLLFFAVTYIGMGFSSQLYLFFILFVLYGIYAASTEGISKAWISNVCEKQDIATAIGTYTAFQSIATLLASTLTGLLWYSVGPEITFSIIGGGALVLVAYFRNI